MAKRISWLSAAEIIGVTPRTMRQWRERMEEHGYDGLRDRRKGKTSQRRVALQTCETVLRLYQEKYFDLNVRHFHRAELHVGEASARRRGIGRRETATQSAPPKKTTTRDAR
jgi:hypothetical protein